MEAFDLAVGLGPARSGLFRLGASLSACAVPETGLVTRAVVGQDSFAHDGGTGVKSHSATPEPGCGHGGLVGVDLGVSHGGSW